MTELLQKGRTHTLEKVQVNGKKIDFGVRCGFQSLFHPLPSGWPCASYGHLQTSSVTWGLPIPTITRFSWWLNEVIIHSFQHTHVLITVSSFLLPSPLPPTLKNLAPCVFLHANVNFALPLSNKNFWLKTLVAQSWPVWLSWLGWGSLYPMCPTDILSISAHPIRARNFILLPVSTGNPITARISWSVWRKFAERLGVIGRRGVEGASYGP